jgi:acyl-[acyl-carrier-protein]-phospholipid O-acyltransferase/long-chain-fatty-acid--[acyl-carrier-protein] ligase
MSAECPAPAEVQPAVAPPGGAWETVRGGLWTQSFLALLVTQFLVTLNDNMFRWLVIPIGKQLMGEDNARVAGSISFLLPFVLLAAPAGYLADRFSKRNVIVGCKVAEIVIVALGVLAILSGSVIWMLVVLTLLASQAALFSPAKMGSIPEIVRADQISAANGWIGLTSMVGIILGSVAGGYLFSLTTPSSGSLPGGPHLLPGQHHWWISAVALCGVAVAGWAASLAIGRLRPANPARKAPLNLFGQTLRDLRTLIGHRPLLLAASAASFFWALGLLSQLNIDKFALSPPQLVHDQQYVGYLLAVLTLGIGVGSLLAGIWSAGKVEVGLVPFGAAGMAVATLLLVGVPAGVGTPWSAPYLWSCVWLLALGVAAGFYDIPLEAFLQHRSPRESRGSILAAYNFLSFSGMLLAALIYWLLAGKLGLSARAIFLVAGLATLPVCLLIVYLAPLPTLRVLVRAAASLFYRIDVRGMENVPEEGGVLLVSNHVSWIDGFLLLLTAPRQTRIMVQAEALRSGWLGRLARRAGAIPIAPLGSSLGDLAPPVREALLEGVLVCIFAEGEITRNGEIQSFHPEILSMVRDTRAPLLPVYLHGLWGSIFSFEGGRVLWKWPRRWPYPVSVRFGRPMYQPADAQEVRRAVAELAGPTT